MNLSASDSAPPRFIERLQAGQSQTVCFYGTSLSFHLAPILREALSALFGDKVNVINAAMSGQASRSGLKFLEDRVLKKAPDTLFLEFAVNDAHSYFHDPGNLNAGISLEESQENLRQLIAQTQAALPQCEIVLMTMNLTWDAPASSQFAASSRPQLAQFYEGYRAVAHERNLCLQDNTAFWLARLESEPDGWEKWIPDGVHPNPAALRGVLVPHLLQTWGVTP